MKNSVEFCRTLRPPNSTHENLAKFTKQAACKICQTLSPTQLLNFAEALQILPLSAAAPRPLRVTTLLNLHCLVEKHTFRREHGRFSEDHGRSVVHLIASEPA